MRDPVAARRWTLVLVNLASIMEKADEVLLPAVYNEVGQALDASPTALGSLTLCRALVQTACYPLAAYACFRHNRAHVIAIGAFLWAAATFLVGISETFVQVAISRGLNGIGLALVLPAVSSLVADTTEDETRGMAFGWLAATANFGSIVGGSFGVLLAPTTFMGISGWRLAFYIVAIISLILGILIWFFAADPHYESKNAAFSSNFSSAMNEAKELIQEAKQVIRIPSFQIIVAQGITGSFPWSALNFSAMWLELMGFSHFNTSIINGLFLLATSIGALFGGFIGDHAARRFPNTGRTVLAQISSGSAIPFAFLLLLALPNDPRTGIEHAIVFFLMGWSISWNGPATNNPIFAEIVPEKRRTTIYALDKSFEAVFAAFAPTVVGLLAEHIFGYKPVDSESSISTDRDNAAALAKALFVTIAVPMALCCLTYSFLYCTYPRDRERVRMDSLMENSQLDQAGDGNGLNASVSRDEESETDAINQRLLAHQAL